MRGGNALPNRLGFFYTKNMKLDLTKADSVTTYELPSFDSVCIEFEFKADSHECSIKFEGEEFKECLFNVFDYMSQA